MLNQKNIASIYKQQSLLAEFRAYEGICRGVAKQASYHKTGDQICIQDVNNEPHLYEVRQIVAAHPGLVGQILTPAEGNEASRVIISWSGTRSAHSALIDLESAPGEESYRASELIILAQINVAIAMVADRTQRPVEVVFSGYSLGGALAQLTFNTCQRAIASNIIQVMKEINHEHVAALEQINDCFKTQILLESKTTHITDIPQNCRSHFHHVNQLSLGVSGHTGVLKAVEKNSNALESQLEAAGVHQTARFMILNGDWVPKIGPGTILTKAQKADVAILRGFPKKPTFKEMTQSAISGASIGGLVGGPMTAITCASVGFCAPVAKAVVQAHIQTLFDQRGHCQFSYELLSNQNGEGSLGVKAVLKEKSKFFQQPTVRKGLYFLRHLPGQAQSATRQGSAWVARQLNAPHAHLRLR